MENKNKIEQDATASAVNAIVNWQKTDGMFWVRIFGRRFTLIDKNKHPPLFSERYGYRKVFRVGKWGIEWLAKY